jgi:hypothetical protein
MYGLLEFLQRSPIRREHVAGSAAWGQQLVLALGTIVILSAAQARHRRGLGPRSGRLWLLAPLGRHAARRVARGPSYADAMACHYLDLFLLAASAAWLMGRILPR